MNFLTPFFDKLKPHHYSIITALIIGIITALYLLVIVPNNEKREDANNLAIFKGIEGQLKGYIDDKLQGISPEKMMGIKEDKSFKAQNTNRNKVNPGLFYIDKIEMESLESMNLPTKKLLLKRNIHFKKEDSSKTIHTFTVKDTVQFDLDEFIKRISASSNFKSFFVFPVAVSNDKNTNAKPIDREVLISQNVNLKDEDSLYFYNRNYGPITFKKSATRYYTTQVRIPNTTFTLFFAAGISSSYFQSNVQYIKPNHLIFGLLLISILFLSICFIKPVVMSYKELLSQMDLIRVVFSIGALIAILVIFGMVGFWKTTISNRNKSDLKQLVHYIDTSFKNQIDTLKGWRENQVPGEQLKDSSFLFKKLYLAKGSEISLINGDSLKPKASFMSTIKQEKRANKIKMLDATSFNPNDLKQLKLLDVYFWMNEDGLLTGSLDKDNISFPRKFNDRNYFKLLQNKEINTVLTGVFSRESDQYQWIYAEKDKKDGQTQSSDKFAIKGIAFREQFSKNLKLPPDTDYMLVSRDGFVLAQYNPTKKLYQNVLSGSNGNLILASVLAGCKFENFRMDYQGNTYQVHAKKLSVPTDLPVYILGIRNLSYLDYLSQFTFMNAVLIVLAYGLLIVLLILIYSSVFFSGRLGFFSREHFYHLFHDYSKKEEYYKLFYFNCICLLATFMVFLCFSPIIALYTCFLIGFNITFINIIVLNKSRNSFKKVRVKFILSVIVFSFILPLFFLFKDHFYISIALIITSHIGLILFFRKEKTLDNMQEKQAVVPYRKVQRKAYLKFITSALTNHFMMFPFILVCTFYSNEINDYASYYCSPSQPVSQYDAFKWVNTYGCDCKLKFMGDRGSNNENIIYKLNFGFEEPTRGEVNNYTINEFSKNFYFKALIILTEANWNLFFIFLGILGIVFLAYSLLNFYANQFFFFELMQASYAGYFAHDKNMLSADQIFINMVFDSEIKLDNTKNLTDVNNASFATNDLLKQREAAIQKAFDEDKNNEILPIYKKEFLFNTNLILCKEAYSKIWKNIADKQKQNVLYDFAQDYFSNYKNKDIIMEFMNLGLIKHDEVTGRLKIRSESFRRYILFKTIEDSGFVEQFKDESKNGTFDKLKLPIIIIAASLLVLLMYINNESYERVAVMGSSIGSAILLVDKFLSIGKG